MDTPILNLDRNNAEQQLAYELIANTNKCLFITGKAGTGKTTFIQRIQDEIDKNFLILAPTGIAAIAAGGETIHSFFGFPLEAIGPRIKIEVSDRNEYLLQFVDSIIIDEASMVRCDMVDGMDKYLRLAFHNNMPFGGKQVIFVGDLFQLPPVVKRGTADDAMLCDLYGNGIPFFYKAHVMKRLNLPQIEFQKVYRQKEERFVNILNKIRIGDINNIELSLLDKYVELEENVKDYAVIVTSLNKRAKKINEQKLDAIEGDEVIYEGIKCGNFKPEDCPAPELLKLKIGAQVIFCRNDYNRKYANGTVAKVIKLEDNEIQVQLENGNVVNVDRAIWASYERHYNPETKKMESEIVGTYTQFPIKLAWAITIHRSQGMTFERMHFDLTCGTFATGQAYVALSRMRSLEGLTLSNPLRRYHVTVNPEVKALSNSFNDKNVINDEMESGKIVYQYLRENNYDMAALSLLNLSLSKISQHDYRNAALLAKQMYDVVLDDDNLFGKTAEINILQDCSMTCNFLNSIICLYGNRYEEAIGYANLVLNRRQCLEAIFVKARAFYQLENYTEAYNLISEIVKLSDDEKNQRAIDKKLLLFKAKVNDRISNPNIALCNQLLKICPICFQSYIFIRKEMRNRSMELSAGEEQHNMLIMSFNDKTIDDSIFMELLSKSDVKSHDFKVFKKHISKAVKILEKKL